MANMGVNFKDLRTAVDWSVMQLNTPRQKRIDAIKQYVGNHYADGGSDKVVPTNFIELAVTIYMQQLAARAPRCSFKTKVQRLKPFAYSTEIELNKIPEEIGLDATLRRAVIEALFSYGIVKVGVTESGVSILGHDVGEPFADPVSMDDYFCDMSAKTRSGIQFEGNDYWIPVEDARDLWEGKSSDIEPDKYTLNGDQGQDRAESVSTDEGAALYKEKVWLRDVWLLCTHKLLTYGVKSHKVFNVVDWDGPDHGPYHMLGFSEVPGNLLPLPPVALWIDLHNLSNTIFRKLGREADSKKTVGMIQGGNDDDVDAFIAAKDGELIRYNGQKPETISVGGIDESSLAFYLQCKSIASYFGGNWDALGGLAPMSDTIGQDEMMKQGASARVEFMRGRTLDFAEGIYESLAWYRWTNPSRESVVEKPVKGTDFTTRSVWSAETRDGDWLDYNFDIDAYSMRSDSPELHLQKILQFMDRVIYPAIPLLQEQGATIDYKELTEISARLSNVPELNDIIKFGEPHPGAPEQGSGEATKMSPNTTRTNVRVNRPGATRQGQDDAMSKILMGGKVQKAEADSIGKELS